VNISATSEHIIDRVFTVVFGYITLVKVVWVNVLVTLNTVQIQWQKSTGSSGSLRCCWLSVFLLVSYSVSFANWARVA
jgi:hypothetical protein